MMKQLFVFLLLLTTMGNSLMAQVIKETADANHIGGLCMEGDSTYHIRHNIDLNGKHVLLEEGATIVSEGGIIDNGTLVGNATKIVGDSTKQLFGNDLRLLGSWNVSARPEWFGAHGDGIAYWEFPLRCYANCIGSVVASIRPALSPSVIPLHTSSTNRFGNIYPHILPIRCISTPSTIVFCYSIMAHITQNGPIAMSGTI